MTSARGSWMGNRGVIHNEQKEITRTFKHKAWIICRLEFKDRKRIVMTPNRWTELFFLDEATAFAAGHRPCFECRKEDANRFKLCWIKGNPQYNFTMKTSIKFIDEIIHSERTDNGKRNDMHSPELSNLPTGTFIQMNGGAFLFANGRLHQWTPFGYDESFAVPDDSIVTLLTPRSIVNAFLEGYVPEIKNSPRI